uniref:Type II secretion system protein n=1 Tax=candidate division CPR3 bacterium TaxID=2268181 RepID=A0A7C4R1Y3_UNCC3
MKIIKKQNFSTSSRQAGFTLIEVLVVIGITAILMALAIPSETSYRHKAELKQSVKQLRSLYWEAQGFSLAPRTKDVVSYGLAIAKQTMPSIVDIVGRECKDNSITGCDVEFNRTGLGKNIYIDDILCFGSSGASSINTLATYFLVSEDNKASGTMSFYRAIGDSNQLDCDKIEIGLKSTLFDALSYKITLDKANNSITYGTR